MNQICKVCGEPAAGFHFGAFTCEGCKSFFGRSYNNLSTINECKNDAKCIIDKKNRTTCKACRLRKCYTVGMSKGGSRYGRRSNWFKIHCLLQEQQQQATEAAEKGTPTSNVTYENMAAQQHMQRNSQFLAAQRIGNYLGYTGLLGDDMMKSCSPFMSTESLGCHSAKLANTNGLAFINMINSLPMVFPQVPTSLMFTGCHSGLTSYTTSYDTSSEVFQHRQSLDSYASIDSMCRYSPVLCSDPKNRDIENQQSFPEECSSPELCVSDDNNTIIPVCHKIHTPKVIRANVKGISDDPVIVDYSESPTSTNPIFSERSSSSVSANIESTAQISQGSVKTSIQIGNTECPIDQDRPMDLSVRQNFHIAHTGESDTLNESSEDDLSCFHQNLRRKFCQFTDDQEPETTIERNNDSVKRRKVASTNVIVGHSFPQNASVASLQGIFVCV